MQYWCARFLALAIPLSMLAGCGGQVQENGDSVDAGNHEQTLWSESSAVESKADTSGAETITTESHWSPPPEELVGCGHLYSPSETAAYKRLAQWVEHYSTGISDQIYIDGDGLPQTWRLTCDGTDTYKIELQSAGGDPTPVTYHSSIVLEGAVHYSFGSDVDADWLPLEVIKEYATGKEFSYPAPADSPISLADAVSIAMEADTDNEWSLADEGYTLQHRGYFDLQGVIFYRLGVYQGEDNLLQYMAVSVDGAVVLATGEMHPDVWDVVNDKNEGQVVFGEVKASQEHVSLMEPETPPVNDPLGLVGCWHDNPGMGAVHGDLYAFYDDGTYVYSADLNRRTERLRMSTGNWWMEGDKLYMSATHLISVDSGTVENDGIWGYIDSGEYVIEEIPVDERAVEEYQIETVQDEAYYDGTILLGDQQLWRKDGEVTVGMSFFRQYHLLPYGMEI